MDALARIGELLLHRGGGLAHGSLGLLLDALHRLLQLVDLALAHRLVELGAELRRLPLDDAHVLADGAQQRRQVLGADHEQRHDAEDQQLAGGDVEHQLNPMARSRARFLPHGMTARRLAPNLRRQPVAKLSSWRSSRPCWAPRPPAPPAWAPRPPGPSAARPF